MRVYLVQHGEAKPESEDPARPLTEGGRQEAERVARRVAQHANTRPHRIVHSGRLRARQTAGDPDREVVAFTMAGAVCLQRDDPTSRWTLRWSLPPDLVPFCNSWTDVSQDICPGCFLPHPPAPALRPATSDVRRRHFPGNSR